MANIAEPKYIAQDADGSVCHYRMKPIKLKSIGMWADNMASQTDVRLLNHPTYTYYWRESLIEWVDHVADTSKKIDRYTVEPHGKGYAVYLGRDNEHHGANLAHLSECSPAFAAQVQALLNGSYTPQVNKSSSDDAMLAARKEGELAQSKEANAGLMRACDYLERELADMTKQRDHYKKACDQYSEDEMLCKLAEVTKQRDALAEALEELERTAGQSTLWDDPARHNARKALAAVKGGSHVTLQG
jgi:hypothetical protein